jgi:methionyl aminopeptidase
MISIKSNREIQLLKEAGRIVALVHKKMAEVVKPGISTEELDRIAEEVIRANGATPSFKGYQGFPGSICASINNMLVHGIPDKRVLRDGDIISIDVGACYKGYHGDSAWTYAVGNVSEEHLKLMEVTHNALFEGLKQVKPGNRVGDISNAIQTYVESFGYSLPIEYTGHGVGKHLHEDPAIPNVGRKGTLEVLKKGMCIAIEPMVFIGRPNCRVLPDGWGVVSKDGSWAAHYEHTVVITDDGYEITTKED